MRKVALFLTIMAAVTLAGSVHGGDTVHILVLREHGGGSAARAQPHLDALVGRTASVNGWSHAAGLYVTREAAAEAYIGAKQPHYGMFSLSAFLRMRNKHSLAPVGYVDVKGAGGRSYYIVSKTAASLADCKGSVLSTNHASDPRFINRVVARGAFTLSDFDVQAERRPLRPIKKVSKGKAKCALIDDAQQAELSHLDEGAELRTVWQSKELPEMAVVAFSSAPAAERAKFTQTLGSVCSGDGSRACEQVGIRALAPAAPNRYSEVIALYGN